MLLEIYRRGGGGTIGSCSVSHHYVGGASGSDGASGDEGRCDRYLTGTEGEEAATMGGEEFIPKNHSKRKTACDELLSTS